MRTGLSLLIFTWNIFSTPLCWTGVRGYFPVKCKICFLCRFRAFYLGFHSVCASNALIMLRPEEVRRKIFSVQTIKIFYESNQKYFLKQYFVEVEILVCGAPTMDLSELRKVVVYDGYRPGDETIQHFWEVTLSTPRIMYIGW